MRCARRLTLLAAGLVILTQTGCVMLTATAIGGGAVGWAYINGKHTRTVDASLLESVTAVDAAIQDLGLTVRGRSIGSADGEIESSLANGDPVVVELERLSQPFPSDPAKTRIGVRVRAFGDQKQSELILDRINFRLKTPPAAPLPPATLTSQTDEPGLAPATVKPPGS